MLLLLLLLILLLRLLLLLLLQLINSLGGLPHSVFAVDLVSISPISICNSGDAMAQVRKSWIFTVKVLFRSQDNSCVIFGGHSRNGTGSSLSTSTFLCHCYPTKAPYPYIIHLPPILHTHTHNLSKYQCL
jgi:hypothetical protein